MTNYSNYPNSVIGSQYADNVGAAGGFVNGVSEVKGSNAAVWELLPFPVAFCRVCLRSALGDISSCWADNFFLKGNNTLETDDGLITA